jgi:hypothetical protein
MRASASGSGVREQPLARTLLSCRSDLPHPRFARGYLRMADVAERRGAAEHRRRLLSGLTGAVLELRAGQGLNAGQRRCPVIG